MKSPVGRFEVTIVFVHLRRQLAVFSSLEAGEWAFHTALEKGIAAVNERRDVSMGEGFCK